MGYQLRNHRLFVRIHRLNGITAAASCVPSECSKLRIETA
jgi:hypothetical protein